MTLTSTPRQRRRAVAARAEAQPTAAAAVSWLCGVCQFENDAEGEDAAGRCGMCGADGGGGSEEQVMAAARGAARGASNRSVRSGA
jgi:hypothetical protein